MMRNVYLQGELGEKFGNKFSMDVSNPTEIIKCINANRPNFKNYLIECDKNDIGFTIEYQNDLIGENNLLVPLKEGDVTIAIIPAGSKSGIGKLIAAAFLAFVILPMIGTAVLASASNATLATLAGSGNALTFAAAMSTIPGQMVALLALNLAMSGIQQMMAPDPAVDSDAPENYSFNGNAQNIKQGDPVPVLYGELRVPGRPISINVTNTTPYWAGEIIDGEGNIDGVESDTDGTDTKQHENK